VAADRPVSQLALRLCEVDATGKSWLITYGLLNLTQRESNVSPKPLVPGQFYDVPIELSAIAYRFKKGTRIRLSVSESLWPLVWPSPQVVTLKLDLAHSRVDPPVRTPPAHELPFDVPELPPGAARTPGRMPLTVQGPNAQGMISIRQEPPSGSFTLPETGTKLVGMAALDETLTAQEGHPNAGVWQLASEGGFQRGGWDCRVHATCRFTSTEVSFVVEESLEAFEHGRSVFKRSKTSTIPRRLI